MYASVSHGDNVSAGSRACPRCGVATDWSGDIVFRDRDPAETVTYLQCRCCSHIWIPDPPVCPRWPEQAKEASCSRK